MEKFTAKMIGGKRYGKTKEVLLEPGEYLHENELREVRKTKVFAGLKSKTREVPQGMVLKKYSSDKEFAIVVQTYEECKKRGLKLSPTFRANKEARSILMTNLNRSYIDVKSGEKREKIALASNNITSAISSETPFISNFLNFPDFVTRLYSHAVLAAKAGIALPEDSYFFLLDRQEGDNNIDFVIGDLEGVKIVADLDDSVIKKNIYDNVDHARDAARKLLQVYLKPEAEENGSNVMEAYVSELEKQSSFVKDKEIFNRGNANIRNTRDNGA